MPGVVLDTNVRRKLPELSETGSNLLELEYLNQSSTFRKGAIDRPSSKADIDLTFLCFISKLPSICGDQLRNYKTHKDQKQLNSFLHKYIKETKVDLNTMESKKITELVDVMQTVADLEIENYYKDYLTNLVKNKLIHEDLSPEKNDIIITHIQGVAKSPQNKNAKVIVNLRVKKPDGTESNYRLSVEGNNYQTKEVKKRERTLSPTKHGFFRTKRTKKTPTQSAQPQGGGKTPGPK